MKRGHKKAQVTVFIVVAIAVVVIIGGVAYFQGQRGNEIFGKGDFGPVRGFIQQCLDETLNDASDFVAMQGGYYNKEVKRKDYLNIKIPYYWLKDKSQIPELKVIEKEISEYMVDNFDDCMNDFTIFKDANYEIETSNIEVNSLNILDGHIKTKINLPTTVKIGDKVVEYTKFDSSVSSDLKKAYDFSKQIIEEQKNTPNEIPLGFIMTIANDNGFTFETINLEEDDVLYSLIFEAEEETEFIYVFIADYDWSDENETN